MYSRNVLEPGAPSVDWTSQGLLLFALAMVYYYKRQFVDNGAQEGMMMIADGTGYSTNNLTEWDVCASIRVER